MGWVRSLDGAYFDGLASVATFEYFKINDLAGRKRGIVGDRYGTTVDKKRGVALIGPNAAVAFFDIEAYDGTACHGA